LFALLVAFAVCGCKQKPGADPPPTPKVVVIRPATAPAREYYEYNGYLDTTETVEVRARVKGLLTGIHFTEGTEVRGPVHVLGLVLPGQLLYEIDEREYITAE
jgi:multidrug efflux pump subunit AcrA (membrane-fusion protein)